MRLLLLGLAACGFSGKDLPSDAIAIDTPTVDAASDDASVIDGAIMIDGGVTPGTCEDKWKSGSVALSNPVKLAGASGRDPFATPDETQLFWNAGGVAYTASLTGTTIGAPSPLQLYADSNMTQLLAGSVSKVSLISGNKVAAISQVTTDFDVALFERSTTSTTKFFRDGPIGVASSLSQDYDPEITPDGLTLVWAPAGTTQQQIHIATRATTNDTFGNDMTIDSLGNPSANHADPTLNRDKTILLYSTATSVINYAILDPGTKKYVDKGPVPNLHVSTEGDPHLSPDACHVYFGRAGATDFDFYFSQVL